MIGPSRSVVSTLPRLPSVKIVERFFNEVLLEKKRSPTQLRSLSTSLHHQNVNKTCLWASTPTSLSDHYANTNFWASIDQWNPHLGALFSQWNLDLWASIGQWKPHLAASFSQTNLNLWASIGQWNPHLGASFSQWNLPFRHQWANEQKSQSFLQRITLPDNKKTQQLITSTHNPLLSLIVATIMEIWLVLL